MAQRLTCSLFADHLGERFRIVIDADDALEVELIEAVELASHATEDDEDHIRRDPFSLLFLGPKESYLPQRTYELEHPQLEPFQAFVVPIGPNKQGMRFEIIFN